MEIMFSGLVVKFEQEVETLNGGVKEERRWDVLDYESSDLIRKGHCWKFQVKHKLRTSNKLEKFTTRQQKNLSLE